MRALSILRMAATLAALQGIAHGILFIFARPRHGAAEVAVIEAMRSGHFFAGGLTYWDFYFGYGLIAAAACLVEAVLLWQLSRLGQTQPAPIRPMVALFIVVNLAHALLLTRYFRFPLPIAFDIIIASLLLWAWIALGRFPAATRP